MKCFTLSKEGRLTPGIRLNEQGWLTLAPGHGEEIRIMTSPEQPPGDVSRDGRTVYRVSLVETRGATTYQHIVCNVWWLVEESAETSRGCIIHVDSPAFINITQVDTWRKECVYAFVGENSRHRADGFRSSISEALVALRPEESQQLLLPGWSDPVSIGAHRLAGRDIAHAVPLSRAEWFRRFANGLAQGLAAALRRITQRLWTCWLVARGFAR